MTTSSNIERKLLSRLKLRQLKLLTTISEQKNILKASQQLNIAQPAATKIVRDIEETLHVRLFERSSRGVTLTPYGEIFIKHAKLILAGIRHASEEITSLHEGASGHIKVGTLLAAAPFLLPKAIALLKEQRPNLLITIIEGANDTLLPALQVGDIDIVVGRLPAQPQHSGLTQEILYYEPVSIVARKNHPLIKAKKLTLKKLFHQQWILPVPQTALREQIDKAFEMAEISPPGNAIESVSLLTNLTLLTETDMVAAMPLQVAKTYEDQGLLAQLPISLETALGPIGITIRDNSTLSPAANLLLSCLKTIARQIVEQPPIASE